MTNEIEGYIPDKMRFVINVDLPDTDKFWTATVDEDDTKLIRRDKSLNTLKSLITQAIVLNHSINPLSLQLVYCYDIDNDLNEKIHELQSEKWQRGNRETLKNIVSELINDYNLTQIALADMLGLSRQRISQIVTGKDSPDKTYEPIQKEVIDNVAYAANEALYQENSN